MYIKEIKINGFKSFADKTNIELIPTFTGIVGPNGSGKSNIVDAIKWVLGEQSVKNLRGTSSMADVIFGGSKSREASRSASVAVIFDNTDKVIPLDYTEVMIKRVVYSTGENEYFINNDKCRLKDINDLFLDSFAGKETFNIIAQGKVSEILSNKPEDRRIILEEAAGVLKYKKRKEESLRKLAKTHENINRIDMIIDELAVQVEPLKEQSEKAKIYIKAKEELDDIDIALSVKDITTNNEKYKSNKQKIDRIKDSIATSTSSSAKEESETEKLKLKKIKLEETISKKQQESINLSNTLNDLSKKLELAKERVKYDKNSSDVKNQLVILKEQELKIKNSISLLEKEIQLLSSDNDTIKNEIEKQNKEHKETENFYNIAVENERNLNRREYELKSQIEVMENNILASSKVPFGVKSVINNPLLEGVINTIGNIIETKKEYMQMLDIALGTGANFVITRNEIDARKAIDYLKQNGKGRVTFFPQNIIKPKSVDPNIYDIAKTCKGFIDIAANLTEYKKEFHNIVMNQLGNVIVADNLIDAQNIAKQISNKYRIVTLEGDTINVGGSLTGGSLNKSNSTIRDRYELERLKSLIENTMNDKKEYQTRITTLSNELNIIKENIYKNTSKSISIQEQINSKNNTLKELNRSHDNIKVEIKDLSLDTKEKIDENIASLVNEYYKIEENKAKLDKDIEYSAKDKKEIEDLIEEKEQQIKKDSQKTSSDMNELKACEIENSKLEVILDNLLNKLNEEYSITYELASEKYALAMEENEARIKVADLKRKIKSLGNVNLDSIEEYDRVNKRYTFLNTQKEDLLLSEQNILEIINNMDNVMIDKFATTFHRVNKEFNDVFKILFNGGNAELRLTDPTNMLETGIEIIANPPGKKPANISLLSGGEKTLTAISLLFSIMNLKNVPFVILDEVESALDEANVDRFGKYIEHYKNKTQLLIITHKKKTMEYVDLLYGITMQESGVSKLVSVKLEDVENK